MAVLLPGLERRIAEEEQRPRTSGKRCHCKVVRRPLRCSKGLDELTLALLMHGARLTRLQKLPLDHQHRRWPHCVLRRGNSCSCTSNQTGKNETYCRPC